MSTRGYASSRSPRTADSRRSRRVLATIAVLSIIGASPLYVQPLMAVVAQPLLTGIDHVGAVCITALHLLLLPAYRAFHIAILAGVAWAVWDRVRAWRSLRRLLGLLEERTPTRGDAFWQGAAAAGVDPSRLRVVSGLPNPAFTAGLWMPRVYLAEELAVRLTPEELGAVVAHEGAHLDRHDPLRLFLVRLVAAAFFWIPALRRLEEDVRDDVELSADAAAARKAPLALASAILALADWNSAPRSVAAVGFHSDELLERRVRRLAGEDDAARSHLTSRSMVGAALALGLLWTTGLVVSHPMPNGAHGGAAAAHCHQHDGSAFGHLFCLRGPLSPAPNHTCPHHAG